MVPVQAAASLCRHPPAPPPLAPPRLHAPCLLSRLLSLEDGSSSHSAGQQQPQQQAPPQQHCGMTAADRQAAKAEAKARAKALAADQPKAKPPKGPCGTPAPPPQGGEVHPLPLASALRKGLPPWNLRHNPDLTFARLVEGADALHVRYPAGSSTPSSGCRGGVQMHGEPPCLPARDALLRFDVRTAPDFPWTKGGKMGGGLQIGQ